MQRVIVSDEPGTTRDAVDTILRFDKATYRLIDTAGIKKKIGQFGDRWSVEISWFRDS